MIKVTIPNNNINERKYILDIIFEEFLCLEYNMIVSDDSQDWQIELNDKKLVVKDTFFSKYRKDLEYLKLENIPSKIEELDMFAASFFMLTRWEEYVNKTRDSHNRFAATESLAFKEGFLDRPIVNEYIEELKKMLLSLDGNLIFKTYKYKLYLTHDVDFVYKWDSPMKFFRHLLGDIILRKSIKEFFLSLSLYFKVRINKEKDPYDTFDYLMNLSEKLNTKSYFFFMSKGETKYDNNYKLNDSNVLSLIKKIKKRNHYIGIHPTYNAYNNLSQFYKEKKELESICNLSITFGREHFLRFEVPTTWQIWEDNNMKWDSSCSYADLEGFRCGVCYEYSVFNILTRKKLNLKEKPLIVMEGSVVSKESISSKEMEERIKRMMTNVKKYNGEFVFLWHNSSFNLSYWNKYSNVYENVLKNEF